MGLKSFFSKKETDLLNYAHTVRTEAVAFFDTVVEDLKHASDVYAHVQETVNADLAILEADFNKAVAALKSRGAQAQEAQAQAETVISKIEALTTPAPATDTTAK